MATHDPLETVTVARRSAHRVPDGGVIEHCPFPDPSRVTVLRGADLDDHSGAPARMAHRVPIDATYTL
jgi:hypothetical protein